MQVILIRMHRLSMVLVAALLFGNVLISSPADAQTRYSVTEIRPRQGVAYTFISGINNKGQIVGADQVPAFNDGMVFIYENGTKSRTAVRAPRNASVYSLGGNQDQATGVAPFLRIRFARDQGTPMHVVASFA